MQCCTRLNGRYMCQITVQKSYRWGICEKIIENVLMSLIKPLSIIKNWMVLKEKPIKDNEVLCEM